MDFLTEAGKAPPTPPRRWTPLGERTVHVSGGRVAPLVEPGWKFPGTGERVDYTESSNPGEQD